MYDKRKSLTTPGFYSKCWNGFGEEQDKEALWLLFNRLVLNKVPLSLIEGKKVLDMGCGSGRYSRALLFLGAKEVVGIDKGARPKACKGFSFKKGSVLKLPFKDNSFDFVYCNGVLHHTKNCHKGLKEMFRVMKPGGHGWLMLCGKSKYFDEADKLRGKLGKREREAFRYCLEVSLWQPNKIFFLEDLFFSPSRHYFTPEKLGFELLDVGFDWTRHLDVPLPEFGKVDAVANLRFLVRKPIQKRLIRI